MCVESILQYVKEIPDIRDKHQRQTKLYVLLSLRHFSALTICSLGILLVEMHLGFASCCSPHNQELERYCRQSLWQLYILQNTFVRSKYMYLLNLKHYNFSLKLRALLHNHSPCLAAQKQTRCALLKDHSWSFCLFFLYRFIYSVQGLLFNHNMPL